VNPEEFGKGAAAEVRRHPSGYWAAYPKPIPPHIPATWDLFASLSEADRAISELAGVARTLPNPHLLIQPFIRKEAVLSSKIEGTQASLSDLLFFEASEGSEARTSDVREVSSYIKALEHGLSAMEKLPLSLRLLRDLHGILLDDPTKTPGEFRTSQNWIGRPGCTLSEASYIPPPPDSLVEPLGDFEKYLHAPSPTPPLIRYAIAHYQFEAIHPFLDGNGRLGRLLITLLLCADPVMDQPLLPQPLLYLSAFFEQNRDEYYGRLAAVSKEGDWIGWLRFFLKGVAEQSRDAVRRSDLLFKLRQDHRQRIQGERGSALVQQIDDFLFSNPVVSVPEMARRFGRTFAGTQNAVNRLVELQILHMAPPGAYRSRLYAAWDIIHTVES